jgi:hypothetical protein
VDPGEADVEAGRQVLDSLAKLEPGVGWIWAPEQGVLRRMRFPPIATYDSGRTPDGTETPPTITPASIDLVALAAALGSDETAGLARGSEREGARRLASLQKALDREPLDRPRAWKQAFKAARAQVVA